MATILIVDDEPDVVELVAFNLRRFQHEILTATNGRSALIQARAARPDLIVLDLMLPEVDGFTVCEILRCDDVTAGIPVIMLTAVSGEMSRLSGLETGANDYVTKPFSPRDLVSRVHKQLHLHPPGEE